ncbi:hydroxylysine kinase-like [Amphiura filiformis]|uniref:hydroxylysine kinase-like n=1 Tax=Amphiura filiformis TaxID=82378 RepID=UPI003B20FD84
MASQSNPSECIEVQKPFLTVDDAAELFSHLYGMPKATSVKPLNGYDAQNFLINLDHVGIDDQDLNQDPKCCTQRYVLKIMSGEESKDEIGFRAIHSIQKYLKHHGYTCAAPLQNIHGDDMKIEEFTKKQPADGLNAGQRVRGRFMIRAYPFLPGVSLTSVGVVPANSTQVFYEAGKSLAQMHKILQKYPHDTTALKEKAKTFEWSLDNLSIILKHVHVVKDQKRRDFIVDIVKTFESRVLTIKDQFRKGIIHNDFSDTNVLVTPILDNSTTSENSVAHQVNYKLSNAVDFDDSHYNCLVFDIGISMMYMAVSKPAENHPLHASAAFLAGYQHVNPLTPEELEVLHICQAARFAQSLIMGLYTYTYIQPGNDYLLLTQNSWPIIEDLWEMKVDSVRKMWTDVAMECAKFDMHA